MKVLIATIKNTISIDISPDIDSNILISNISCYTKSPIDNNTNEETSFVTRDIAAKEIESDEYVPFLNGTLKKNGIAYSVKNYVLLKNAYRTYYIFSFEDETAAVEMYDRLINTIKDGIKQESDLCFCDIRDSYDCVVTSGEKAEGLYSELMQNKFE